MFNPRDFYQKLVNEISEKDIRDVALVMLQHIGEDNSITLRALTILLYKEFTSSTERKTRLILEDLVTKYHFPIGAYSGKSGRWLCRDREEINHVIADLESRRDATSNRIQSLRLAKIPAVFPKFDQPKQIGLWG